MHHINLYKGNYIFIYCKDKGFSKAPFMVYPINKDVLRLRIMWEMNFYIHCKIYDKLEFSVYAIKMNMYNKKYNNIHKFTHKLNLLRKKNIEPLFKFNVDIYENMNYTIKNYAYTIQFNDHLLNNGDVYLSNPIIYMNKHLFDQLLEE